MNHFTYKNGELYAEDVSLTHISEQVGTPFYCYSSATLERHYRVFDQAMREAELNVLTCFALKANSNIAVVKTLARLGAGADVVSEGELRLALKAGVPASKIVFSGVGKTKAELELALSFGIMQVNIESEPELDLLAQLAEQQHKVIQVAIRVNPDIDAKTHEKITTGLKGNKFGIEWERAIAICHKAKSLPFIKLAGVACHIGSQLSDVGPFSQAFSRMRTLFLTLKEQGIALERLDLGGGLGVPYAEAEKIPSPMAYAQEIKTYLGDLNCQIVCEPGRLLVGNAGILVSAITYVKSTNERVFVIVDAGMNDLMRPALYDSYHSIIPVLKPHKNDRFTPVDVVGPVCESADCFAKERLMPPLVRGNLLAFYTAGAYGATMSSGYNSRPLVPEVLVKGKEFAVVRRRPSYEEMMSLESLPYWL